MFLAVGMVLPQRTLYGQHKYEQRCQKAKRTISIHLLEKTSQIIIDKNAKYLN